MVDSNLVLSIVRLLIKVFGVWSKVSLSYAAPPLKKRGKQR
jgi:hypothetical protein